MSSLHHLSRRDLEALSAYLDGELRSVEVRRLEARLHQDRELRAALTELRSLRDAVRSLPQVQPPRSLILTPDMVGRRAATRAYPGLQLATALATVAFLLVSGANAMLSRGLVGTARAPAEAPAMLQAAGPPAEATEVTWPEAAAALGEVPSSGALAPSATPEMAERAAAADVTVLGGGLTETPEVAAPPAPGLLAAEPSPTGTPVAAGRMAPEKHAEAAPLSALAWLQLGLGALVIGLAMLSLRVRRQAR